jgi:hypothetical protein
MQLLPIVLMGLSPVITYVSDRKSIKKVAIENMWWEISIKKVPKIKIERTYLVSYQDINGNWCFRYCVFTKTGLEWRNEN